MGILEQLFNRLGNQNIILASTSCRRQEILNNAGIKFKVVPSQYEENLNPADFETPAEFAIATAVNKVTEVEQRLKSQGEKFDLIIGADTVVYKDKQVYGKPKTEEEAYRTLKSFSGDRHSVYTGVNLRTGTKNITFSECTDVYFGDIPDEILKWYVKTGDCYDKAGGYGIQAAGGMFIRRIEGDYYNVVGLPLYSLWKHLLEIYPLE